ncbi:hypothetical protein Glove_184g121 [Diversispora epigaea]|uniref:Uncharacterized protein n=1 Tax=Diversispora epigaea TaxID=1348612 RepID=A0A397IWG6_9GLOM|nr:hypothetical protein Glove_184g121 [Diversispora epigaea]
MAIWKAHFIGIRAGNYEMQHAELSAFSPLFPSAGKNNYSKSVTHHLAILSIYPQLKEKLCLVPSVNLTRKGHFLAFDEALEMFGVKFIKQNITGNCIDEENLKFQIKASQEECERIDFLLSKYLDNNNYIRKERTIDKRKEPLWNLITNLLSIFETDSGINDPLFQITKPKQLNSTGLERLEQCYQKGLDRMKEIFLQEVLEVEKRNTKGRKALGIVRTTIKELSEKKEKTATINIEQEKKQPSKRRRIISNEEKTILASLFENTTRPSDTDITPYLNLLSEEWDIKRIKTY